MRQTGHMPKMFLAVCAILVLGSGLRAEGSRASGSLYFDRGHYWIELTIEGESGDSPPVSLLDKRSYVITLPEEEGFGPSRVELLSWDEGNGVLLLSSGRLKGRVCCRVTVEREGMEDIVTEPFCDPFYYVPGAEECAPKGFFRKHIAPAFGRSGDEYNLNRFRYEYELDAEKSQAELTLQPSFEIGGFRLEPSFDQRETQCGSEEEEHSAVSVRSIGFGISRSGWAGALGLRFGGSYRHERSRVSASSGDSTLYGQEIRVLLLVRLDNVFDSLNRHCISVFKGVDAGFGYAWYASDDEEVWGESGVEGTAPFMLIRLTWTLVYGLQLSYSLESAFPSELEDRFEEYHTVKIRLLLRDLLEPEARRAYHPDLEFVYEGGRGLPIFEYEERISIGFTFDLFPW